MTKEVRTWTVAGICAAALILGWLFLVEVVIDTEPSLFLFIIFAAVMIGAVVVTYIVSPQPDEE